MAVREYLRGVRLALLGKPVPHRMASAAQQIQMAQIDARTAKALHAALVDLKRRNGGKGLGLS
jgi:hypothetical protein